VRDLRRIAGRPLALVVAVATATWLTGVGVLVAMAAGEVAREPSLSLLDGYWVGRLPWTNVGVVLVLGGATVAVLGAATRVSLVGGWASRISVWLAALVAAFWWFLALIPPPGGALCTTCGPRTADPIAYAYSLPESALLLLVAPAAISAVIALVGMRASASRQWTGA